MSKFLVDPGVLKGVVSKEETLSLRIEGLARDLDSVRINLALKDAAGSTVKSKLGNLVSNIRSSSRDMRTVSRVLDRAVDEYVRTENRLSGKDDFYRTILKGFLDALGEAGDIGTFSAPMLSILKVLVDGDGVTAKDIGTILKGFGKCGAKVLSEAMKNNMDSFVRNVDGKKLKEMLGWKNCKTVMFDSTEAGWLRHTNNFKNTFSATFLDKFGVHEIGPNGVKGAVEGTKVAGWVFSIVASALSNYDEYNESLGTRYEISEGRAFAETISEAIIDTGKFAALYAGSAAVVGAGMSALVAAGLLTAPVTVPAVVVGGVAVAAGVVIDVACKKYLSTEFSWDHREKGFTELVSDWFLDSVGSAMRTSKPQAGWVSTVGQNGISSIYA